MDTLATGGPFTVFAPTDAAFAKVPKATLDALAADPAKLKAVLLYHVVPGRVTAADVVKLTSAKTAEGRSLGIKVVNGSVFVDGAPVTTPDVEATNGVIHVINSVLIPKEATAPKTIVQTAVAAGSFKTLASLLKKAGLVGTLQGKGPFTVFAPTDAAFAKLPKATLAALAKNKAKLRSVLLYHVVKGNVSAAKVVTLAREDAQRQGRLDPRQRRQRARRGRPCDDRRRQGVERRHPRRQQGLDPLADDACPPPGAAPTAPGGIRDATTEMSGDEQRLLEGPVVEAITAALALRHRGIDDARVGSLRGGASCRSDRPAARPPRAGARRPGHRAPPGRRALRLGRPQWTRGLGARGTPPLPARGSAAQRNGCARRLRGNGR